MSLESNEKNLLNNDDANIDEKAIDETKMENSGAVRKRKPIRILREPDTVVSPKTVARPQPTQRINRPLTPPSVSPQMLDREKEESRSAAKYYRKERIVKNIKFLLAQKEMKIGDLEDGDDIKRGYMSRVYNEKRETTVEPTLKFVVAAARLLNVSVDALLNTDFTQMSATEAYLFTFFSKLTVSTEEDKLDWQKDDDGQRISLKGFEFNHPLFKFYDVDDDWGGYEHFESIISDNFGEDTMIAGGCYHLKIGDNAILFLMNITKEVGFDEVPVNSVIEIWMAEDGQNAQFLCDNTGRYHLRGTIDGLYSAVDMYFKKPRIQQSLRHIIDAFMSDDK